MRILFATCLAGSFIGFAAAFAAHVSDSSIKYQTLIEYNAPDIPASFRGKIEYPVKTSDPNEPPTAIDDGPTVYRQLHKDAWNGCLSHFYSDTRYDGQPVWELDTSSDWFIFPQPDHHNEAEQDGWFACVEQLQNQLTTQSENELRNQLAANLFDRQRHVVYAAVSIGFVFAALSLLTKLFTKRIGPESSRFDNGDSTSSPR